MIRAAAILCALALAAPCACAQVRVRIDAGRAVNVSGVPFEMWGGGWQAGLGLEHRFRGWFAVGLSGAYQSFPEGPSVRRDDGAICYKWIGQASWHAPLGLHLRLIRPGAILNTHLRLGGGVMASHIGQLTSIEEPISILPITPDTTLDEATGFTKWRPFVQAGAGIKVPVAGRFGLAFDVAFQRTLDGKVILVPLTMGLCF